MIENFQSHDAGHYFPLRAHPDRIREQLLEEFSDDPVDPNDWGHSKRADPMALLEGKRETLRRKLVVFRRLLENHDWDFAYLGLDECHELSHLFWHLHDNNHPRYKEASSMGFDPIEVMLRELDRAVGELLDIIPSDCLTTVITVAGIAGNYHWSHLVDDLLDRFLGVEDSAGSSYGELRRVWNLMPHAIQRPLHAVRHRARESMLTRKRRRRIAFALPLNEIAGAVRVNVVGREPAGLVQPEDLDQIARKMSDYFLSLRCTATGAPLVRNVLRCDGNLGGRYIDRMPDLLLEWNTDQPIYSAAAPGMNPVDRQFEDARTGHHINEGFVIHSGSQEGSADESGWVRLSEVGQALLTWQFEGQPFAHSLREAQRRRDSVAG
jgi:predicted AlkP superfamily phosphohydrolase/phosphomutase